MEKEPNNADAIKDLKQVRQKLNEKLGKPKDEKATV